MSRLDDGQTRGDWVAFGVLALIAGVLWMIRPRIIFIERLFTTLEIPLFSLKKLTLRPPPPALVTDRQIALDQQTLVTCQAENAQMKTLLNSPPVKSDFLLAHVLGYTGALKIDRGESAGVKVGQAVIADKILIGRVLRVRATSSLVQLFTDPALKISVLVQKDGQTQARGLLSNLILDQVVQEEKLSPGDLVISDRAGGWPPSLLIGTISDVLPFKGGLFRQAKIQPLVDYANLDLVFVINQ